MQEFKMVLIGCIYMILSGLLFYGTALSYFKGDLIAYVILLLWTVAFITLCITQLTKFNKHISKG